MRKVMLGLVLVGAVACSRERPPNAYVVTFIVESDPGRPLPGARVDVAGKALGETGADGRLRVRLRGQEGAVLPVQVTCPEGFRQPETVRRLALRTVKGLDRDAAKLGIPIPVSCPPALRQAAVVVRAAGFADLPVLAQGREIGRTDPSGVAHLAFRLPPGSSIRLQLDTSANPYLRPTSPAASFRLEDSDEVFVFDQAFEEKRPTRRVRRRHHRPKVVKPQLPEKIK